MFVPPFDQSNIEIDNEQIRQAGNLREDKEKKRRVNQKDN